jgi:hypothetical protein
MEISMELLLIRNYKGLTATLGSLYINDQFECYTLEDVVRQVHGKPVKDWKIKEHTAIPTGRYEVVITFSNRFKCDMPLLLNVEGFEGIRIHPGNTHENTEGCILVGNKRDTDAESVLESRVAYNALLAKLKETLGKGEKVYITVA